MSSNFESLEQRIYQLLPPAKEAGQALQLICDLLCRQVAHYDWVGFYFAVPTRKLLVLGPFCGTPTEHTQIPYGRGICGQTAESLQTLTVQDVSAATNYLACSLETRAEIVVPIFLGEDFLGEIDIDSHTRNPFTSADEGFLERVAGLVAPHIPHVFDAAGPA